MIKYLFSLVLGSFFLSLSAQNADSVLLWPTGAPAALGANQEDKPRLIIYPAPTDKATGAAVVVCPGGGYSRLAKDHEGRQVAAWLNSIGVSAFVLYYRLGKSEEGGYRHPSMLLDGRRAIRYVRHHAAQWKLNPDKIGILGFSAGGHLASTVGTHFEDGNPYATDPIDRENSRPNFMVLAYPVISFTTEYTHRGSRLYLLGPTPEKETVELLSSEKQVSSLTPPTFLVHTDEDSGVPPENSILFYLALRKAGVPAEMHIFRQGRHGLGLGNGGELPFKAWPELCRQWMHTMGLAN